MSSDKVSSYLSDEWAEAKGSEIHLYRRISAFLRDRFPDIEVASELEKELRIRSLVESGSFNTTHRTIGRLACYTDYSEQQAVDLLEAALTNSQIRLIAGDPDVRAFFGDLGVRYALLLDDDTRAAFEALFGGQPHEAGDHPSP